MADHTLLCQLWSIREFGKPTVEGEFCSLHVDEGNRQAFVNAYWEKMPQCPVPDSYACPANTPTNESAPPYPCRVDPRTFERVRNSGIGLWSTTIPKDTMDAVSIISDRDLMYLPEGLIQSTSRS